jgi:hypothetical protein
MTALELIAIKDLEKAIEKDEQLMRECQARISKLQQELADIVCPFKRGDIIEWGNRRKFRGKVLNHTIFCGGIVPVCEVIVKKPSDRGILRIREVCDWDHPHHIKEGEANAADKK